MAAKPCVVSVDPMPSTPRTGIAGLFNRLIRTDQPESTKRTLALMSAVTLCLCTYGMTLAVIYQAIDRGTVDGQLVFALLGVGAWTAGLAGVAYRKQEGSAQ